MKQDPQSTTPAETLDAQLSRRREQLATVTVETAAADAALQAIESEREPLTLRSLDDPASEAALEALEARDIQATARKRALTAKADALQKAIAALDEAILRRDYGAGLAALRAEKHADLVASADDADQQCAVAATALQRFQASADAFQRSARALGFTHVNRLGDRDMAAGSFLFRIDPRREIAQQIDRRYRRPLAQQVADAVPPWALEDRDPPKGWQPTHPNTDDAPSAATADTAAA